MEDNREAYLSPWESAAEVVISNSNCVLSSSQNNGLNNRTENHNEGNAILCTENKEKLGVLAYR